MRVLLVGLAGLAWASALAAQQDPKAISQQIQREVTNLESQVCSDAAYKPSCDKEWALIAELHETKDPAVAAELRKKLNDDNRALVAIVTADKKYSAAVARIQALKRQLDASAAKIQP